VDLIDKIIGEWAHTVTVILPNGMEIVEELQPNGEECCLCVEDAVTLELPGVGPQGGLAILNKFCLQHLKLVIDTAKEVSKR